MGIDWPQERTARRAIHKLRLSAWYQLGVTSGRGVRSSDAPSVATHRIVCSIADVGIEDSELRVVENVERFHAELQAAALGDLEVLEQ